MIPIYFIPLSLLNSSKYRLYTPNPETSSGGSFALRLADGLGFRV